jgi:hypothetical protein
MKKSELQAMSLVELTGIYNKHAAKPIKKFSGSKEAAIAKVIGVLPKASSGAGSRPRVGSGEFIREKLRAGGYGKYAVIVELVKKTFPTSRATEKDVAWHANKLREQGEMLKSA